ncbi:hypothetical protein DT019_32200 [Streptomyces sp. SDr-06]|uniref:hypothetical protein n=1 Tax=Streptomyces sp. SDr-06 TaxID=2267702 RepID=UPI000DEA3F97|nr:hypothetical protein [Streptomyces sp. SDr-06]RCH64562.1 hypothetical protein DT019_32200 [Streptomyces sp. SDr-06]
MNAMKAGRPGAVPRAVLVVALLYAAVAACGESGPGDPAAVAPPKPSATSAAPCGDGTTEEGAGGAGPATEDEAGTPGPPTDQDAGSPGPPTDRDAGSPGPPTDGDAGSPGPPTDADPGTPGPPTDGTAPPCLPAGWFDMTRDFVDYYGKHLTKADDGMWPSVVAVRIRKQGAAEQAVVTVNFTPPAGDGGRVAEVFADWRHAEYGDKGALRVETRSGGLITEGSW